MKFLAVACALTTTAHASKLKMCGDVTMTVYKDSNCKTKDSSTTENMSKSNFSVECFYSSELASYVKYECNTENLVQTEYS